VKDITEYLASIKARIVVHSQVVRWVIVREEAQDDVSLIITTESQSAFPQQGCPNIFTWTTQFRKLELSKCSALVQPGVCVTMPILQLLLLGD
jgi:hypothetical protein